MDVAQYLPHPGSTPRVKRYFGRTGHAAALLLISVASMLSACTTQEKRQPNYKPQVALQDLRGKDPVQVYRYEARYPQLRNMEDESIQRQVNGKIETCVENLVKIPPEFRTQPLPGSYTAVGPEVALVDHGLLSIAFYTERSSKEATHPALGVETLNIDLGDATELSLPDLFIADSGYLDFLARRQGAGWLLSWDRSC